MAAPLGNDYWTRRASDGRPRLFATPDDLWNACVQYFEWVKDNPLQEANAFAYQGNVVLKDIPKMRAMTLAGLCIFLDIDRTTWADYRKRDDFTPVTTRVDEIIWTQKFEGAAGGQLNANIIARDLGLAERQEHTGKDGGPIETRDDLDRARRIAFILEKAARAKAAE